MNGGVPQADERVLVLAPTGRDSALLEHTFGRAGIACSVCDTPQDLVQSLPGGAAAIVVAEEALSPHGLEPILAALSKQPAWSDLAVILLTFRTGEHIEPDLPAESLGNVVLLERPVGVEALLSVVRSALRARQRQYQVRTYLEELEQTHNALKAANGLKDELLALVSHELRTPLTTIVGAADLLRRRAEMLDQETRESLVGDIARDAARLQRLIENMLVLSKAETSAEVTLEPLLLQRVLPRIVADHGKRDDARPLQLRVPRDLPPILANETFVEQIIANLIRNAEKYSGPAYPIEVNATAREGVVECRVADRGRTLSDEEVRQMFELFYRDGRTSDRVSELGLGLPVCRRLAEAQHGRIFGRARPGGGLVVCLELPVARSESEAEPALEARGPSGRTRFSPVRLATAQER